MTLKKKGRTHTRYDSKVKVEFRLHIEHFERRTGDVWGVSTWINGAKIHYLCARAVVLDGVILFTGRNTSQPWAYLTGVGRVIEEEGQVVRVCKR